MAQNINLQNVVMNRMAVFLYTSDAADEEDSVELGGRWKHQENYQLCWEADRDGWRR